MKWKMDRVIGALSPMPVDSKHFKQASVSTPESLMLKFKVESGLDLKPVIREVRS